MNIRPGADRLPLALRFLLLVLFALQAPACFSPVPSREITDPAFERLCLNLSEEPGYFDTDNLISNETSYQHVLSGLAKGSGSGRAYIGVGPGQNFTYISHLQPEVAFIVDIRRDNQLLHLYFKELFRRSQNRWEFLSRLLGKPLPEDFTPPAQADASQVVEGMRRVPSHEPTFRRHFEENYNALRKSFPELVGERDRRVLLRMALPFFESNFDLRFRSHGRRPRSFYPDFEELILAQDLDRQRRHYLDREEDFQFLRRMQLENRIVPLVGDLAGSKALAAVADYLDDHNLPLAAFYLSNVEFYLFYQGTFGRLVKNIDRLPIDDQSVLIRSHFGNSGKHPAATRGHYVTSVLQSARRFLELNEREPYWDYRDLATRDYLHITPGKYVDGVNR